MTDLVGIQWCAHFQTKSRILGGIFNFQIQDHDTEDCYVASLDLGTRKWQTDFIEQILAWWSQTRSSIRVAGELGIGSG